MSFPKLQNDIHIIKSLNDPQMIGAFNTFTLSTTFNFDYSTYKRSFDQYLKEGVIDDVYKTVTHEFCHYYQLISTPTGLYINNLRDLQTVLLRDIVEYLKTNQIPVHLPLIDTIENLPQTDKYKFVWVYTYYWYLTEYLLSWIEYKADNMMKIREGELFQQPIECMFHQHQRFILDVFRQINSPMPPLNMESCAWEEMMYIGLGTTMGNISLYDIMESAAYISQYWNSPDSLSILDELSYEKTKDKNPVYIKLLNAFKAYSCITSTKEFVFTYLTVCDLALMGPLPEDYKKFREDTNMTFWNCLPVNRFFSILHILKKVHPVKNHADYDRFVEEVCQILKWCTPLDVAYYFIPKNNKVFYSYIYYLAMEFRRDRQCAFMDMSVLDPRLNTKNFYAQRFYNIFMPVSLNFTDVTKECKDIKLLKQMKEREHNFWYYRNLFLKG